MYPPATERAGMPPFLTAVLPPRMALPVRLLSFLINFRSFFLRAFFLALAEGPFFLGFFGFLGTFAKRVSCLPPEPFKVSLVERLPPIPARSEVPPAFLGVLVVVFFAVFFLATFLAGVLRAVFLAVFLTGVLVTFLTGADSVDLGLFFTGAFFAGVFFAGVFFAGVFLLSLAFWALLVS
jgi:hypothetical protein